MYDSTARFMANKLKEYCVEQGKCSECAFGYYPTYIGSEGEYKSNRIHCGLFTEPYDWTIPEEVDSNDKD